MADVFVSYKAEDRRRVKPLVAALQADGLTVWWDEHIGGGSSWRRAIETELTNAKCVVVVWSKRSVGPQGEFVQDEAARAKQRHVYVPVTIDKVHVPLGFGETQAIALNGWTGSRSEARYQSVLGAIRSVMSGTPLPGRFSVAEPVFNRRLVLGGGAAASAVAVALGGWFVLKREPAAAPNRIAVLPFANLSGDPAQAYFSDGIAEELRTALARVGMQVIGRTSSDAVRNMDAKAAAAKLGVSNILTGSVRRSPQTIRIDAQLLSGSDGVERWSEAYDRQPGDTIKIQTDIAENVARALSLALGTAGRAALTIGGTTNPAAQDFVLKVIHDPSDSEAGIERKLALLDGALELDPNYAEAYARKAYWVFFKAGIYAPTAEATRSGEAEGLALADRAITIAPDMALGYAERSVIHYRQLHVGLALADAKRAVNLPGADAVAFGNYAVLLGSIGRFDDALRLSAKAIALDPLSPRPFEGPAQILYFARRYSEAAATARQSLHLAPDQEAIRAILADALLAQGKFAEAESEYAKLDPTYFRRLVGEAVLAARASQLPVALDRLKRLQVRFGDAEHYQYSEIYAQLGMIDNAFRELTQAWQVRDPGLADFRVDPFLDPLRSDPRFAALERKIGPS